MHWVNFWTAWITSRVGGLGRKSDVRFHYIECNGSETGTVEDLVLGHKRLICWKAAGTEQL